MLVRWLSALGLALVCGASCRAAMASGDLPDQFSVVPVAHRMRLNGLPLEIHVVTAPMPPRRACALVAEHWSKVRRARLPGCRPSGDWLLVSACAGSRELTLQLRGDLGGSRGYLSSIDLRTAPARTPVPLLSLPPGTQVRSVLQSSGPDGDSVQYTMTMPTPPPIALQRITDHAVHLGWQLTGPLVPVRDGTTFELRRATQVARGILTRDARGSGLILLEVDAGSLRP
jgi:hypothetical protein